MMKNYFKIFGVLLAFIAMGFTQAANASSIYLIGEVDNNSWACDYGAELTQLEDDIYYGKYYVSGYFAVVTELNSDWDTLNSTYRYGPATDGESINIGGSNSITKGNTSFQIGTAGTYEIYVNMGDMTISFSEVVMLDLTISPESGTIAPGTEVTMSCSDATAKIYYTLDGTTPSEASTEYTAPVALTEGVVTVSAIAISADNSSYVTTATYNVSSDEASAITVRFQKPTEWDSVYLWAWTDSGNLFSTWPGQEMEMDGELWATYTFDESIVKVNIIFANSGGTEQTADITNVVATTSYVYAGSDAMPTIFEDSTLSVAGVADDVDVVVYPNPMVNTLNVVCADGIKSVEIVDITGKVLISTTAAQVDVAKLPTGIYLTKINGSKIVKVLKK
ncbi:MAG: starch-binding protein [Bacteroidales bacterium]